MRTSIMAMYAMSRRQAISRKALRSLLMAAVWLVLGMASAHAGNTVTTVTYVYTNAQGTPLAKADVQGNIIARYTYRPYGSQQSGPTSKGPGYTGHMNDPDTGLVYMQQRYYDPDIGGFISPDPINPAPGNIYNFNRYAYAANNPIRYTDPDGRCIEDFCITEGGAVGCALTGPACPAGAVVGALVGITASAVVIIIVHNKIKDKPIPKAKGNRDKNRDKGVPDSQLGPSGKPKRHSVNHPSIKRAKDAAREESGAGGSVEKHANPEKGSPHYHGKNRKGDKDRIHHNYPDNRRTTW